MNDAQKIIDFIHYTEKLKTELRLASKSDKCRESVADHTWRLSLMLILVVPKLGIKVDHLKILKMAIIHDVVEIEAKDIPRLESIVSSRLSNDIKLKEKAAINNIKKMLGDSGQEIFDLWNEFDEYKTNEAKALRFLDKLEGQLQFLTEDVTTFTKYNKEAIQKIIDETKELSKVDPFLTELDNLTLQERKERIKL
ncbi:HAD family hydrolase [bacterium CG_4_10_14_0_2_um_filter_33_32]|nr:MAG: hypothetical protein AUJ93_00175 [bacterium CG2_30_33_46]PIR67863.1 MAG: HAD family hydrolase [bacterium CG10_big_fil_rev_8_21_14_0_10_33_18]PIU76713.1 MAG: HAD family hydrolase [bacterium CG06_land_8_20_14_3_00_33_50]PIW81041.1 MAG: HAD family hydrolase [bacterium CG_4_8_14_3_um_filter_33_28]PIY84836.1 MAG: HAD family hydrolase [bacterium CG_4_10_14_0_8_um_filter_33_57]PIZ86152.1 MAG: HAD family hydrolase [bacterium CG_4_10_14_0_2_um_filter_33_32]PJA72318.1 MAG: HAD family hydrolase 